ncbi:hypothetical protein [Hoeflea sp.]|jgi:hypothetical protein|uniref:hypothetical protein n=1 Tax=Hoeflea sp. TaxID=1940281 RepID=UPI003BAF9F2F
MEEEDLTLETLLSVRAEVAIELDKNLLQECYLIQKRMQFSTDRAAVITEMERLIDASVDREVE